MNIEEIEQRLLAADCSFIINAPEDISRLIKAHRIMRKALKNIDFCTCDAQFSGQDEAEYRARGCPPCICDPYWKIAKEALAAVEGL